MCRFHQLNKACPQDPFPLPRIDQIVDSTTECGLLCFLDAFSGYHQIKMAVEDVEKTAFLTPCGVYCYTFMPFGLRNAGAMSAFWEQGSPDLPAYSPRRGYASRPYGPSSSTRHSRPSRGANPRGADDARPPLERPRLA